MAIVSRDFIAAQKVRTRVVDIPEWGEDAQVEIRELTLGQQNVLLSAKDDPVGTAVKVLLAGFANPKLEPGDAPMLRELGSAALDRISKEILDLSGMTPQAQAGIRGK